MLIDYHIHPLAHGGYRYTAERLMQFVDRASALGIEQIGFADHEGFASLIDLEVLDSVRRMADGSSRVEVLLGIEIDYRPERENEIRELVQSRPFDYVIGSVHHIGDWPFDHPDYRDGFEGQDIDGVYKAYYRLVEQAAGSGLFDIIGHMDLVKIWGHRPVSKETAFVLPFISLLKETGTVVEINTAGLRKPVQEIYPGQAVLELLFQHGIPVTFGSDAHSPQEVGEGLELAWELACRVGYRKMVCFRGRKKQFVPLK